MISVKEQMHHVERLRAVMNFQPVDCLPRWKPFILNWHKHRIRTGKMEVINGKIGTLQRNAYGYRDDEYLKLRIVNLHRTTYALNG